MKNLAVETKFYHTKCYLEIYIYEMNSPSLVLNMADLCNSWWSLRGILPLIIVDGIMHWGDLSNEAVMIKKQSLYYFFITVWKETAEVISLGNCSCKKFATSFGLRKCNTTLHQAKIGKHKGYKIIVTYKTKYSGKT